jgi:hypothetical protein
MMRERPQDKWYEPDIRAELRKYQEQHIAKAWRPVVRWGILVFMISALMVASLLSGGSSDSIEPPLYEEILCASSFGLLCLRFGYCAWRLYKMKRLVRSIEHKLDAQTID